MIPLSSCGPKDEIFSFLNEDTGEQLHFNATVMYAWCVVEDSKLGPKEGHPCFEKLVAPIDPGHIEHILLKKNIEQHRLDRLCEPYLSRPALSVLFHDGTTTMIDGHHRLVVKARLGDESFVMYRVFPGTWEMFLVPVVMGNIREYLGVDQRAANHS